MISILGPLTILDRNSVPVQVAPKPRQVLALLATHPGQLIPITSIARELWDDPPRSATTTIQTYVGQLRKILATALEVEVDVVAEKILVTETGGYALHVGADQLDVLEYVETGNLGKAAVRSGDDEEGLRLISRALSMWRGPALANVEAGRILQGQVARLEECRLCCHEHRVVAALRLGDHHEVVSQLVELTSAYPLHENLHGHLMLALYRCGRRPEALITFQNLRARLVDELGLDPSPALMQLHQAVLSSDASLHLPRTVGLAAWSGVAA